MALGSYGLWTICALLFCNDKGEQVVIQLGQICIVVIWYTNVVEKLSTVQMYCTFSRTNTCDMSHVSEANHIRMKIENKLVANQSYIKFIIHYLVPQYIPH